MSDALSCKIVVRALLQHTDAKLFEVVFTRLLVKCYSWLLIECSRDASIDRSKIGIR